MTWQYTLTGLLIGVLVGPTGMGGGSLMTPILILLFGFNAKVAVGTDILHGAIFKSFGAVRCRQLGTVHARLAAWMFLGSGPMSLAGVMVASSLGKGAHKAESYAVGAALILGSLGLVAKTLIKRGVQPNDAPFLLERRDKILATTIGAVFGFIVGLTSVGSGTFFGLAGVLGLSGLKLVNVPEATYVLSVGVALVVGGLVLWAYTATRAPRVTPARAVE